MYEQYQEIINQRRSAIIELVLSRVEWHFHPSSRNGDTSMKPEESYIEFYQEHSRHLQRDRNITKIKKAVSAWSFGDGLSDEDLEQIWKLIEVKSS